MFTVPALPQIHEGLRDMAFGDISRAIGGQSVMGGFILAACFIDYMAGFWHGPKEKGERDGDIYQDFLREFLPMYNAEKLYSDLRCRLVHNYSEGGSFIFAHEFPDRHLTRAENGKVYVNLENFVEELRVALDRLLHLVDSDGDVQLRAIMRWREHGILVPKQKA